MNSALLAPTNRRYRLYYLLSLCLLLVPSQLSPVQAPDIKKSFPIVPDSKNITALTVPAPPSGFSVDWHYDTNEPLNVLAVYLSAIDCMYSFAQRGWDDRLNGALRTWAHGFKVEVDVTENQGILPLLTSYVVVGLYRTMEELLRTRNFCKVTAALSLQQRQIGNIRIQNMVLEGPSVGMESQKLPNDTIGISSDVMATNPSGRVIDSDDHRFTVAYVYGDARIDSQDIFMAVLNALANAAPHADDSYLHHLAATSPSGKCEIVLFEVPGPHQITYSYATKALRVLVWDVVKRWKRFGELTFDLNWEGVDIAKGYFRKVELTGVEVARREAKDLQRLPASGDQETVATEPY